MDQLHRLIAKDVTRPYNEKPCKDMDTVLTYDINNWLSQRPIELVKHLQELCNLDFSPHLQYLLRKVIEQIYNCRNTSLILPLGFRENLITYKFSNNPLLSTLNLVQHLPVVILILHLGLIKQHQPRLNIHQRL